MSKFCMLLLPIFVWMLSFPALGAERDPLLMGGALGDGVAKNGWATDACVTGTPKVTLYKSPKISYLIENTKKNLDRVVQIKAQIALGEVQLENPQLTSAAHEVLVSSPSHFSELCGQYYSGYIYGGVISISRKINESAVDRGRVSLDHSGLVEQLLAVNYQEYQKDIEPGGLYLHMNPINEDLLNLAGDDIEKVLRFVEDFKNKKAESQNIIQPFKSFYKK